VITANVWERAVHVLCGGVSGTGFTLDHDGRHYLVTARHVVKSGLPVKVLVRGKAVPAKLTGLTVPVKEADVAVFRLDRPITPPDLPLTADMDGMIFGQDAYFLGFPFGVTFDLGDEYFPLVKRCTISGTTQKYEGRTILLLDGWNNRGFSGGPVVFQPPMAARAWKQWQVAGIVTRYRTEREPVTEAGRRAAPGAEVRLNTRIIIAEQITRAMEAIDADTPLR